MVFSCCIALHLCFQFVSGLCSVCVSVFKQGPSFCPTTHWVSQEILHKHLSSQSAAAKVQIFPSCCRLPWLKITAIDPNSTKDNLTLIPVMLSSELHITNIVFVQLSLQYPVQRTVHALTDSPPQLCDWQMLGRWISGNATAGEFLPSNWKHRSERQQGRWWPAGPSEWKNPPSTIVRSTLVHWWISVCGIMYIPGAVLGFVLECI